MPPLPFQLRYSLTRWQRLGPHLRIWQTAGFVAVLCVGSSAVAAVHRPWWFLGLLPFLAAVFRGFLLGLVNAAVVRRQPMDLLVDDRGIGFLLGGQRWYVPLDGLTAFGQLIRGVWTVQHWNGVVLNIPADLLDGEQAAFFQEWVTKADAIRRQLRSGGPRGVPDVTRP